MARPAALPPELAAGMAWPPGQPAKRERTRRLLINTAVEVFCARGLATATLQEVAQAAGLATATVYNHFASREELAQAVALWLTEALSRRIADSAAAITDGAQRMAIANHRYLWLAQVSPAWAALLLDIFATQPALAASTRAYAQADLRLGLRQKTFKVSTEAAALDLVFGTVMQAMRMTIAGLAPDGHAVAVVATVLTGLGMPQDAARALARKPLPPLS